ncbi:MAG: hypothetical protein J6I73_07805 [Treponema sp.]|nr:hypothetical protein [Treponema sp.]
MIIFFAVQADRVLRGFSTVPHKSRGTVYRAALFSKSAARPSSRLRINALQSDSTICRVTTSNCSQQIRMPPLTMHCRTVPFTQKQ